MDEKGRRWWQSLKKRSGNHQPCGKMTPGGGWVVDGCFRVERMKKGAVACRWGEIG
jgi:hypothetical protein